jgi:RNA polymerase sigma-70 factor (ECF subfamily)
MSYDPSVVTLNERLHAGEEDAAAEVFGRYCCRLIALARAHLDESIRNKEDPEELVQSVFRTFFRRQREGQFTFDSWESVWGVLALITLRKCRNRAEYYRAARRNVQREVSGFTLGECAAPWEAVDRDPTPAEAATLADTVQCLLRSLEAVDRGVLTLHLQGYSVPEICSRVGYAQRTVWRSLKRIRQRLRHMEFES